MDVKNEDVDQVTQFARQINGVLGPHEKRRLADRLLRESAVQQGAGRTAGSTIGGKGTDQCETVGLAPPQHFGIAQHLSEELTLENIDDVMKYQPWQPDQLAAGDVVRDSLTAAAKAVLRHVPRCPSRTIALRNIIDARQKANEAISFRGRFCLAVLAVLFSAGVLSAQTTPRVEWTQPLLTGQVPADYAATAVSAALKIDTGTPIALAHTCTGTISPLTCSAPLTATQLPAPGSHRYELILTNAFGSVSSVQTGAPPTAPGGFRIITVTVTVSGADEGEGGDAR